MGSSLLLQRHYGLLQLTIPAPPPPPLSQQVLLLEDAAAAKNTAQAAGWCLICLDTLEAAGALAPGPLG